MTFRPQHALRVLAVTSVVSIFTLLPAAVHAEDNAAWQLLWSNKFGPAATAFRADLAKDPKDAGAWRGLGWINYYRDCKQDELKDFSRSVELAPLDWQSAGLWPIIVDSAESLQKLDGVDAAARVLATSSGVLPALKASAQYVLVKHSDLTQGVLNGSEDRKSLGFITDWRIIGPFDNVSKSGLDKVFSPENEIQLDADQTGKDDLSVKWRKLPLMNKDDVVTAGLFLGDSEPDVFYSASSVNVPESMDVYAALDTTGASKFYVNGSEVFSDSVYRDPITDVPEVFDVPIHLNKGWNTLLVKLADDQTRTCDFRLRLTDAQGTPVKSAIIDSGKCNGFAVPAGNVDGPASDSARTCFGALLSDHVNDVEGALLLGHYLQMVGDYQSSENVLNAALKSNSKSAVLYWELSQTLDFDGLNDDSRSARNSATQLSSDIADAEIAIFEDQKDSMTKAERVQKISGLVHQFPGSDDVLFELARALQDAGMNDKAFQTAKQATIVNGGSSGLVTLDGGDDDELDFTEQQSQMTAMVKRFALANPMDSSIWGNYAADLDSSKDFPDAIAAYKHLVVLNPGTYRYQSSLADVYREAGQLSKALPIYALCAQECPQSADAASSYGQALEDTGHTSAAVAQYRLAVDLDPAQVDLRDKLQLLTGQKPIADLVPALPTPNLDKLRGKPTDSVPSVQILIDEGREVVYPDYATQTRFHQVIKVNDQSGVTQFQTYTMDRNSGESQVTLEQARLIKADGKIEDRTNDARRDTVEFPSLAPGDIIDVSFRVEDHSRGALARQFWAQWEFAAPETQFVVSRFVLITPSAMAYTVAPHNGAPTATERTVGDWKIREWDLKNGPVQPIETSSPPLLNWVPWIDISTVPSWKSVVNWYQDLSDPRCDPSPVVRSKAAELTSGCTTDDQKIAALVKFVSHDVQYKSSPFRMSAYVPTEGKDVIRERYGDCKDKAALLVAMLSTLGIKAHMALLSPYEFGSTPYLPSPRFAHAIAVVDTAKGPVWVDGTADGLPYGQLPPGDQGVPALEITPSAQDLVTIPLLPLSSMGNVSYDVKLGADGKAKIQTTFTALGIGAWAMRRILIGIPSDKKDDFLRLFSQKFTGSEYDSGSVTGVDDDQKPIVITISSHDDQYATQAGDFLLFSLPWSALLGDKSDDLASPNRTLPVDLTEDRNVSVFDVTVELPDGYALQGLSPKSTENDWGKYEFKYDTQGNSLVCHSEVENSGVSVQPVDLSKYRAYLKDLSEAATAKLVIKKS